MMSNDEPVTGGTTDAGIDGIEGIDGSDAVPGPATDATGAADVPQPKKDKNKKNKKKGAGAGATPTSPAPATTEPATTEPATTEPATTEPATTEPRPAPTESSAPTEASAPSTPELGEDPFVVAEAARGHHVEPVEGRAAWSRLLTMGRPRATRANLLVLVLAVVLGAAIAAQVQLTNERGLAELSQTDLVRVLDDVSVRSARLDQQVRELEATRDRLRSGTGTSAEALDQAQKRLDTLSILAGTVATKGPGITLRISDPGNQVTGPVILDLIQELRDGGAEAIDVGGVRVVASSFVGDSSGQVKIDGTPVARPFVIKAIGDSKTLASAMTIPGGIIESVRQKGANATVTESDSIDITSTHAPAELTHAKPVE